MTHQPDAISLAAGLAHDSPLHTIRAFRPEFVEGAQACRAAVLVPEDDLGLDTELRNAIARRVASGADNPQLLSGYPMPKTAELAALAQGRIVTTPALIALAYHTDMIAANPGKATAADLNTLQQVGYSVAQIVALSELLAYVCFQIRVAHGLKLLERAQ